MTTAAYSLDDWFALGDEESVRVELYRGVPQPRESRGLQHSRGVLRIANALELRLPDGLEVFHRVDVVLERAPATVRAPDLVVIRTGAPEPTLARDVFLAVEVLAPATLDLDRVTKRVEYAAAGIPNYWIIDLDGPSAEVLILVDGRYEGREVTGRIELDGALPLVVDISCLS